MTPPVNPDLIDRAHEHGLLIHTMGIDGVFSDFPDTAVTARELFRLEVGG